MKLGLQIKLIRTSLEISQKDFAESIGVRDTYLSAIENNRVVPSFSLLKTISKTYNKIIIIEINESNR